MPLVYTGPKLKPIQQNVFISLFARLCIDDGTLVRLLLQFDKAVIQGNNISVIQIGHQILDYIHAHYVATKRICILSIVYYIHHYIGDDSYTLDEQTQKQIYDFVIHVKRTFAKELFGTYIPPDLIEYTGYDLHPLIVPTLTYHVIANYIQKSDLSLFRLSCDGVRYQIAPVTMYPKIADFFIRHGNSRAYTKFLLSHKNVDIIVALNKDRDIVGAIVFEFLPDRETVYIHELLVDEYCRGRGIGKSLMHELERLSKDKNIKRIRLAVHVDNKQALQLYKKLGYETVDRALSYLILEKSLES